VPSGRADTDVAQRDKKPNKWKLYQKQGKKEEIKTL